MRETHFLEPIAEFLKARGFEAENNAWVSRPEPGFERVVGVMRALPLEARRQTIGLGLRLQEMDRLISLRGSPHGVVAPDAPLINRCHVKATVGELAPPWTRQFWRSDESLDRELFEDAFHRFLGRLPSRVALVQQWRDLVLEPAEVAEIRDAEVAGKASRAQSAEFFGVVGWSEPPESVVAAALCRLGRLAEAQQLLQGGARRAAGRGQADLSSRLESEAGLIPQLLAPRA